jgi:DNA-binding CsgD family transcriptional regulator
VTTKKARLLLSDREWQVARLISEGRTTEEIAKELGISKTTVYRHKGSGKKKLGKNYRNLKVFKGVEGADTSIQNSTKLWNPWEDVACLAKVRASGGTGRSGKELLEDDIRTGRAAMAFKKNVLGDSQLSTELRLAYGISQIGEHGYLQRKRSEIIKDLSLSSRYKIIRLPRAMLTDAIKEVVDRYKITITRKDLPGLDEDDTFINSYLCRTHEEYNAMVGAIAGVPIIQYDAERCKLEIGFESQLYVKCIRVEQFSKEKRGVTVREEYNSAQRAFEVDMVIKVGESCKISVFGGNEVQLCYNYVFDD